jgi:hypothetical protein
MLYKSEEVASLEEEELSFSNFFPMKYIFGRFRLRKLIFLLKNQTLTN